MDRRCVNAYFHLDFPPLQRLSLQTVVSFRSTWSHEDPEGAELLYRLDMALHRCVVLIPDPLIHLSRLDRILDEEKPHGILKRADGV